ncbi:hypothetical protein [Bacillus sp. OTU2372]|uniref:hypothetical protein n=1 Tax=Bacillus sp. OTU2372 TaxID=3043858 RepID=UPI00313C73F5
MAKNGASIARDLLPKDKIQEINNLNITGLTQMGMMEQSESSPKNPLDNEEDFINEHGEFAFKLNLYNDENGIASFAYHGLAGEVVRTIDPHTESDPMATLINFLTAFGNIIGDSAHFVAGSKKHPLRIFAVIVGATGKGRKGTSLSPIRQLFQAVEPEWEKNHILSGMSSGEGLIYAVRDEVTKKIPIFEGRGHEKEIIDYEIEVVDEGIEDKRVLVIEEEFVKALRAGRRDGNTLSPIIRELWDSGSPRTLTKNPIKATGAHVSILGQITQEELKKEISDLDLVNGMANRFLWLMVERSKLLPSGGKFHEEDLSELVTQIKKAVDFGRTVGEITRDSEAEKYWYKIYEPLSTGIGGLIGAVTSRAEAQTMRLACIYALLDGSTKICVTHLKAALDVWGYCFKSARFIFGNEAVLENPKAVKLLEELRLRKEEGKEGLTRTEVSRQVFKGNISKSELNMIFKELNSNGFIKLYKVKPLGAIKSVQKISLLD